MGKTTKTPGYPELCTSNVLWFVHELTKKDDNATVSIEQIMTEFNIDSEKAKAFLEQLDQYGFVEKIGNYTYSLTDSGKAEVQQLQKLPETEKQQTV